VTNDSLVGKAADPVLLGLETSSPDRLEVRPRLSVGDAEYSIAWYPVSASSESVRPLGQSLLLLLRGMTSPSSYSRTYNVCIVLWCSKQ